MKTYNSTNFFKYTFCEFLLVDDFNFPEKTNYKSKSDSAYFYTKDGVYRKSNHWGRVANCRWKIIASESKGACSLVKNQQIVVGFAKWSDFYPINSSEKIFFIDVNFDVRTANLKVNKEVSENYLFTFSEAQKRIKQIHHLFKNEKWTRYFDGEKEILEKKLISKFINSDKKIIEIKSELK